MRAPSIIVLKVTNRKTACAQCLMLSYWNMEGEDHLVSCRETYQFQQNIYSPERRVKRRRSCRRNAAAAMLPCVTKTIRSQVPKGTSTITGSWRQPPYKCGGCAHRPS